MDTFEQIKHAVDAGHTVHWHNSAYIVGKDRAGYYILCTLNNHCVGLYEPDYSPADFYMEATV